MTEAEQHLIDVAILLAQELQEYVDVAIECAGSNSAELATQELLADWEEAYKACGFNEEDHFRVERAISPVLCTKDAQMTCIVHPTEASLKARIAELEAVAEEAESLFRMYGHQDWCLEFTDLEQFLLAAGYLK